VLGRAMEQAPLVVRPQLRGTLNDVAKRVPAITNNRAYELTAMRLCAEQLASAGKMSGALTEARRAVSLDQQYSRREQLVRFLLAAAVHEPARGEGMREEARRSLAITALDPTTIWLQAQLYRPGTWSEDVRLYRHEFGPPGPASPASTKSQENRKLTRPAPLRNQP